MNWKAWLHGLIAAFVGGGSSALTGGICASWFDPQTFNLKTGLKVTLKLMGSVFLVSGIWSVLIFLKQSPIPDFTKLKGVAKCLTTNLTKQ